MLGVIWYLSRISEGDGSGSGFWSADGPAAGPAAFTVTALAAVGAQFTKRPWVGRTNVFDWTKDRRSNYGSIEHADTQNCINMQPICAQSHAKGVGSGCVGRGELKGRGGKGGRRKRPRTGQMLLRVASPMRWTVTPLDDLGCGREGFNHLLRGRGRCGIT